VKRLILSTGTTLACVLFATFPASSQQYTKYDCELAQRMLRDVAADVEKNYYDPKLHDIDWNAKVQQAKAHIDKTDSLDGARSEIAALLDNLNDSHTTFWPHPGNYKRDYGFDMAMVGDR
jgi:C-terminal processing protease CtpA/Prc